MLPERGTLLAATDLHGNLGDFRAMVARFLALEEETPGEAQLLLCGDLVHGPAIEAESWPEHLGTFYRDQSRELLAEVAQLQQRYAGQVHCLLGNHEHAHLGGPRLEKFHPDEAAHLESLYEPGGFEPVRRWMAGWPLAAVAARAGIVFTHAAPHAQIRDAADLETIELGGYEHTALHDMPGSGPLGALLWARTTSVQRAYAFLNALHPQARVAVFGHDPIREGYLIEHEPLLCVSTSFACHDRDKLYLQWDLAIPAEDAHALAEAALKPLHPR
jgi:hypothetical protein